MSAVSVLVVLIMVSTALFTIVASAETSPEVWTDRDEYAPGETVYIYGDGFVKWSPVTITLEHPDLVTKTFTETPDLYGSFVFDGYVAEWVSTPDVPVNVTATQSLDTGDLVATTQFWDPAAYIEGYTLKPHQRWTHGDVKGYNEGDTIPFTVVLSKAHLGTDGPVTITIGVDMIDINSPIAPTHGIDFLTQFPEDPPESPYNDKVNSSTPFTVPEEEGTINHQQRHDNQLDESWAQVIQVWSFEFEFADGVETAIVHFGAHLAVTDLSADPVYLGASYYPGSALHVRMVSIDPGVDEGNRDVPIMLGDVLTPPDMQLNKCCDPTLVVEGDEITFTLSWTNTGQAAAACVALHDDLPYVVDIDPTSFLFWTSKLPTPSQPLPGPIISGDTFDWYIGYWPGTGPDGCTPPVTGYLQFTATVNTNEPGWYYNWANLTYSDSHGGSFPKEVAWCKFLIIADPSIDVEKIGPEYAHVGDTITYTYTVTNTGDVDLMTDVVDDVLGTIATDLFLEAGESEVLTGTYTITGLEDDPLPNTVTATGTDEYCRTTTDSDSWEVDILHPEIEVYKVGDRECAAVGEVITYTIFVYNPSDDTDLFDVVVYDSLLGSYDIGTLLGGETYFLEPMKFAATDVDPLINIATAEGEDALGMEVSDSASWLVDILHPMIFVDKWANKECAEVGETVVYTIYVMNPSKDTTMDVTVEDPMLDIVESFTLLPGGEWSDSYVYVVEADDPDPLVNEVSVVAVDYQGHRVYASDSWTVDIYHPMIEVTKEADKSCAEVGETVVYWINVTNPSSDTPMYTVVTDDMFGGVIWEGWLDSETKMSFVLPYVVQADDLDPLLNTVTVVAEDPQDHERTASASWKIDIYHPMIDIEKTADKSCGAIGELITYTITVSNPSWDTPMYAEVWDPMFGGIIFADWIPSGMSWIGVFEHVVSENDFDPIINWAWVYAYDPQEHDVYDEDSWTVDIYHPAVTIYKWADLVCAGLGDEIQYYITVTNPSDDTPLVLVEVTDDMFGGLVWTGSLAPLESVTLKGEELVYTVQENDPDPLVNTATVYAKDPQNHEVRGESSWSVDFVHPAVTITKVGDMSCAEVGEDIVYTITVTNVGDVGLNGSVEDIALDDVWSFFDLMPTECVVFTYTMAMPDVDPFVNTATVKAADHQGHVVSASASWSVDVVHPAVEITKTADLCCAAVGEVVTYTIVVTNPASADVWLNGTVYDKSVGLYWDFENLMPGQTLTFIVQLPMPEGDEFINTAYVQAWDHQEHYVYDEASWRVDVVHPEVILTKVADKACAEVGETVTYTITVTNPEWADVWLNGTVYDDTLGASWKFENLMPGQSIDFVISLAMTDDADPFVNTAYVQAWDHQMHEVCDKDSWSVDVVHPMIEVMKTADVTMAHEGDTVWYLIVVSVPYEADVWMNGTVYDAALGWSASFNDLMPGTSTFWFVPYIVTSDTPDPFENIVYVEAYDHQLHLRTDCDSWTVDILHPDIMVTKTGPEKASVGETITYYVTVTNMGDTILYDVTVFDSLKGVIATISEFLVGDTVELSYSYVVPAGVGTLVNTVTADGHDFLYKWVDDTAVWEVFKYGVVKGYKFADLDQDTYMTEGEPGLMNWLIILQGTTSTGAPVYMTRITDSTGFYEFTMLDAGIYTVSEFMLAGWVNIKPVSSDPFEVGSGTVKSHDFANLPTGSISGYKWHDVDIDGVWDAGELGIPGWTIYLYGFDVNGDEVSLVAVTGTDGSYSFDSLLPGEYTVSEEIQDGWYAATLTSVYVDVSELVPFEIAGINFGNARYGSITGFKWLDEYMNRYRDGNEPYLPGWTIVLTGVADNGEVIGPLYAVTDENGMYRFDNLLPGVYTVTEVLQEGWYNVTPLSMEVTLIEGSEVTCAKFGNVEYGSIDGWKFLDWDMDGTKDGNEPGIEGWAITLEGWLNDGDFMLPLSFVGCTHIGPITIYTDADGYWSFENLLPGIYVVSEELVDGWYATTDPSVSFYLCSGTDIVDVKFGNVPYTCFDGYKVEDMNGNGRWDVGEMGIPGWTIVIEGRRNDGVPVYLELTTDKDGYFATCYQMLPGTYWVYEVLLNGWMPTAPWSYEFETPMVMEPTQFEFVFLNFELGKICGYKYEDMNGNGVLDDGDLPYEGWTIYLSGPVSATTTTDDEGYFEFTGLVFGTYTVTEETRDGWVAMTTTSYSVPIASGSCVCLDPFLNVELSTIWGYKFEDSNSNGVWDEGEHGLPGWTIEMIWDADPTHYFTVTDKTGYWEFTGLMPSEMYYLWEVQQSGWTPTTQTWWLGPIVSGTDQRVPDFGNFKNVDITVFKFEDVDGDGWYCDEVDRPLAGWSFVVTGPGIVGGTVTLVTGADGYASVEVTAAGMYSVEELLQDGWCPTTPTLQMAFVLSGFVDPEIVMFGNFECVTITLFKYEDMDSNGIYDGDDEPISGWRFDLYSYRSGYFSVYTGPDGTVDVTFCTNDFWYIYEEEREGWCPVNPEFGMYMVYIESGLAMDWYSWEEQYLYEFGNFECVKIEVFKYLDTCSNGWYDPKFGDVPIEGWYIELYGPTGALIDYGWTDEHGYINFTVCAAGTYRVVEEAREGYSFITPLTGYFEIDVLSGDRLIRAWFGNYLDVEVPIFKYEDANSNGEYDEGDSPLPGWHFELVRDDGTVYSGITDENGMLVLVVNRSGIYTLTEEDRDGWTWITPANGFRIVNVVSGIQVPLQVFGNFHDVTITVFKFEDMDGDGCFDEEDVGLPGWQFVVTGPWSGSGTVITTDAYGYAYITVDRAGVYSVVELVQDGWTPTTDTYAEVMVYSGWQLRPILFGNFEDIEITVFKYEDVNSNGVYDDGVDRPLADWIIYAFSFDTYASLFARTGADGYGTMTLTNGGWWEFYEYVEYGWCPISPQGGLYWYLASSGDTPDVFEYGNFRCVLIDVFKYNDANSNGVFDAGDSPVPGWVFYLYDSAGALHDVTETGDDGHAYFTVCNYDLWTVVEEDREGWTHISPADGMLTVETPSGTDPETLMFGNFMDVWICVFKYHDRNSDGVYDGGDFPGGDYPIEGWEFTISGPGVTNMVAYTDEYGYACFLVNRAGTYTVTEEDRAGWVHVNPLDGTLETDVTSGCQPDVLMFGNFDTVEITVFKFDDIMANGCYDGPDAPLADWEFQLYEMIDDEWVLIDTQFTDEFGYATFLITHAGFYMIKEVLTGGWMCITHDGGATDFLVWGGDRDRTFEFGNFKLGKISGYKWNDIDGDGMKDEGEPGLAGWTIWFQCVSPYYLTGFKVTGEDGYYEFTGLPTGVYLVWEIMQAGWVPTTPTMDVVEIIGHTEASVDFMNFELGCIDGYKYEDMDGDGELGEGDVVLPGWTIYLFRGDVMVDMTVTDADGHYSFCGLGPGTYTVREESRTGWIATNMDCETFLLKSGAMVTVHTFLNFELGCIWGYKFEDMNSNGVWDDGEPAVEGFPIYMIEDSLPGEYVEYTNSNGWFCFDGLKGNWYYVFEKVAEAKADGWTPTTVTWALPTIRSGDCIEVGPFGNFRDVDLEIFKYEDMDGNGVFNAGDKPIEGWEFTVTGPCFAVPLVVETGEDGRVYVTLTAAGEYVVTEEDKAGWMHVNPSDGTMSVEVKSGSELNPMYFGNFELGRVYGHKYYDWNLNGQWDEGEAGLAGWTIWLNGTLVGGGWLNVTRITASDGSFSVDGLPAGTYVVSERFEYSAPGWVPMTSPTAVVEVGSGSVTKVDFGNAVFGLVWGIKFYDKDLDGYKDADEPGLPGWKIYLEGTTDQGVSVSRWVITDGNGYYEFDEVQPGTYDIFEIVWPDWQPTTPQPVRISVAGSMVYFEVRVDLGNVRYATVYGWKFLDTYQDVYPYWPNGEFDEGEEGLGNWEITLQGRTSTGVLVDRVVYTQNLGDMEDIGYYMFGELLPGTYWVNETMLEHFYATRPISNMIVIYPFPYGQVSMRIDFGNLIPELDPELNFVLKKGVNLWSSPLEIPGGMMASELASAIGPTVLKISRYDTTTKTYKSFLPGINLPDGPYDFPILVGVGYFVVTSADTAFVLEGDLTANAVVSLAGGINILGYTELTAMSASELAASITGAKVYKVSYYDPVAKVYRSFLPGINAAGSAYDFTVTQGRAYFVVTSAPATAYIGLAAAA